MAGGHNPRGPMDLDPDVAAPHESGVAGLDRHADVKPVPSGQAWAAKARWVSSRRRSRQPVSRRRRRRIALRVDLDSAPSLEGRSQDRPMVEQDRAIAVAELIEEPGRASMSVNRNVTVPRGSSGLPAASDEVR